MYLHIVMQHVTFSLSLSISLSLSLITSPPLSSFSLHRHPPPPASVTATTVTVLVHRTCLCRCRPHSLPSHSTIAVPFALSSPVLFYSRQRRRKTFVLTVLISLLPCCHLSPLTIKFLFLSSLSNFRSVTATLPKT